MEEQDKKPSQTSILFERYMIWGVLLLLIGALWFQHVQLLVVSCFLMALSLIIRYWKNESLERLKPQIELDRSRIFAGESFFLTCSLVNDKWLPLVWVEWEPLQRAEHVRWQDGAEHSAVIRLLWLMGYQEVKWRMEGQALKRGVYPLGRIRLRSGDGFRFAEKEMDVELMKDLYVYPSIVPVAVPSLSFVFQWGVRGTKGGIMEDPTQVSAIREYQSGDEFRRVDWQSSARTGKLQTKVFQSVVPRRLMLAIDTEGFDQAQDDVFEGMLSVIASVALAYHRQGIEVGHASSIPPSGQLTPLLDDLARLGPEGRGKENLLERLSLHGGLSAPVFYFCHNIRKEHVQWMQKHRKIASHVLFYYLEPTEWSTWLKGQAKPIQQLQGGKALESKIGLETNHHFI
ncbi:DUF58 domain-containing protein [Ammoniphilus sp. YIM 78166]|uniref:DUF58 domain-containing protein n=1 Tax=Ammoniphilus sp. YIM 78166 TaxID=1644106 RepID=UPI001430958B|nr:DUF58 domain-containing protein [Ammoniphilus sp. YIM 78166]